MYKLLLKTHNETKLKYLCSSQQDDYIKYPGSGKYWKLHLKIHGRNITTELLFETENLEEFKKVSINESIKRDIVKSEEYGNLVLEEGNNAMSNENHPSFGKPRLKETKEKISKKLSGENHPLFGKHRSEEIKRKIGENCIMFGKHSTCPLFPAGPVRRKSLSKAKARFPEVFSRPVSRIAEYQLFRSQPAKIFPKFLHPQSLQHPSLVSSLIPDLPNPDFPTRRGSS